MSRLNTIRRTIDWRIVQKQEKRSTAPICILPEDKAPKEIMAWCEYPRQENLDCSWCPLDTVKTWENFLPCLD